MKKGRNCPNCAHPYDPALNKCPYCGTIYFDMSCIDFTNGEPIYLKIKTEWGGKQVIMTQVVRPRLNDIHIEHEHVYTRNGNGVPLVTCAMMPTLTFNIGFEAVPDVNNNLITMKEA